MLRAHHGTHYHNIKTLHHRAPARLSVLVLVGWLVGARRCSKHLRSREKLHCNTAAAAAAWELGDLVPEMDIIIVLGWKHAAAGSCHIVV